MQKLHVDSYKPNNCELGNDINPRDKECRLDKEKLHQILEQLAIEISTEINIFTKSTVYLCRCDKSQKEPTLPPCGRQYFPGGFDIFLLITDKRGGRVCVWVECRVGENTTSIMSRLAKRFNYCHALGNKVSQACCNRGPHASVLLAEVSNVDKLRKMLEKRGLDNVIVIGV